MRDRSFPCPEDTMIPFGSAYDDIPKEQKVCDAIGSEPGEDFVLGRRYLESTYEFFENQLWRYVPSRSFSPASRPA